LLVESSARRFSKKDRMKIPVSLESKKAKLGAHRRVGYPRSMADSTIDWTDETLRPLDELARVAFPGGDVTGKTLRLRARQGKLTVYRPGKTYLASLCSVRQ
jgi:hypothetical protein